MSDKTYSLRELAEAAGVTARTIRYYISKNLMPGPRTRGKNASYGPEHVELLAAIKQLSAEGLTLDQVAVQLPMRETPQLPVPEGFHRYGIAEDVGVTVKDGISPWRRRQINHAIAAFAKALNNEEG